MDYPDTVHPLAKSIQEKKIQRGHHYLWEWKWSGQWSPTSTLKSGQQFAGMKTLRDFQRQHNDANIIALPARFLSEEEALKLV